ncbi:MAG: tetratricopeptide repeat protein [Anaerolineae bacterium]
MNTDQLQQITDHIAKGEYKKAEITIARLMRTSSPPDHHLLQIQRARIRLLTSRPDEALSDLTELGKVHSDQYRPMILELLGDAFFARFETASLGFTDRADTEKAKTIYKQLIESYPSHDNLGWVHYQIGRIALTEGNVEYAKGNFEKALLCSTRVRSLTAYCYERLGYIAYYEERDLPRSQDFLQRAIDTYPQSENVSWLVQVYILLSRVHKSTGDINAALRASQLALDFASSSSTNTGKHLHSEALLNISELLSETEHRDKETINYLQGFVQTTKRPLGIDVTWSRVNEMLGNAYFNLGNYDNAVLAYTEALQHNPDHPWELSIYHRIARCQYHKHSYQAVVETIEGMIKKASADNQEIDDYRIFDLLGNAQFTLQNFSEARQAYETAFQKAPPNTEYKQKIQAYLSRAQ